MHQCRWRCSTAICKNSVGLRDGTFFEKLKLTLKQWLVLMYLWVRQYPVSTAAGEAEVPQKSATHQYFRDICSWRLLHHDSSPLLGGPGVVVHIDESLFCHKTKVCG